MDIDKAQLTAKQNMSKVDAFLPSGLKRREEQLVDTFARHRGNIYNKLQALYEFMDELSTYVSRYTPCKKGCSYCCHIPVSVSTLELEYMKNRNSKLRSKLGQVNMDTSSACPFLSNGACSIYEIRPFFCRRHVMLTESPYWCHPSRCNTVHLPLLNFTEVDRVYFQLMSEVTPMNRIFDIRELGKELLK